jgi:hypothetical protein
MKELIEDLALNSDAALWLTPYRGIPAAPGMPPFDILYLDEDHRVVQEVESYPSPEVRPLNSRTASALVLPPHTIFGSKTLPGDQLDVRAVGEADEVECRRQLLSSRSGQGSVARRKESAVEEPTPKDGSAPTLSDDRSGRLQRAIQTLGEKEAEFHARQKGSLKTRFLRWLNSEPSDRRRARRHPLPGLVAYHWTGGAPKAYHIGDISDTGFYLLTEERPFLETILLMTLQRTGSDGENPGDSIAVHTKVVRWGADGVRLAFVTSRPTDSMSGDSRPENGGDQKTLEEFVKRLNLPGRR